MLKKKKNSAGFNYIDFNKHIKQNLAAFLASVAQKASYNIDHTQLQELH